MSASLLEVLGDRFEGRDVYVHIRGEGIAVQNLCARLHQALLRGDPPEQQLRIVFYDEMVLTVSHVERWGEDDQDRVIVHAGPVQVTFGLRPF